MRILFVASECAPFVKTGGLADVVGALPKALAPLGVDVRVLLPAYPALKALDGSGGGDILQRSAAGLDLLLLDRPDLFDRPGNPYLGPDGRDWPDNAARFAALARAAVSIARDGVDGWRPDIIHAHDWQAALAPALLALGEPAGVKSVTTIHNIAFQGLFPAETVAALDLPRQGFAVDGFEYYGQISFLKAGLVYSDAITTVSPTYARELTTPAFGMGLEGLITQRRSVLHGILNGVDLAEWNPETDPHIPAAYTRRTLGRRATNTRAVERRFGLDRADGPLFCVVSRLTAQKGLDLLLDALPALVGAGGRLALLGSGDKAMEAAFVEAAQGAPGQVGVVIGYDEALSHLLQAGSDVILVPSRFEPCGLTQMYGLRYGAIPLVSARGGLADTVIDANDAALRVGVATGFQFHDVSASGLAAAIERAARVFADRSAWRAMMRRAMAHPVGWDKSAQAYHALYEGLLAG